MDPLIVAHRGAMTEAPENTLPAFDKAVSYGVDGIEFDVQLTADNCPVVYHDATLDKITRAGTAISDFTLAQLTGFDWGRWFSDEYSGLGIPTLDDVLTRYGGRTRLMVEIKSSPDPALREKNYQLAALVVEAISNLVPRNRITDIFVLSFDPEIIKSAYINDPTVNYILNLEVPETDPGRLNIDPEILYGYCIEHSLIHHAFADTVRGQNRILMAYSCNDAPTLRRLMEFDPDVIMTDDPGNRFWKEFDL